LIMVALASSSLVWNMYSLLTPIRYVLNPRFNLKSPIQSGLFYLAPGCGYILGTFFGGRYADYVTISWTAKRGVRVPEDRLRSGLPFMGVAIPVCMLIYGWSVEKRFGGVALPVVSKYFSEQSFSLLAVFLSSASSDFPEVNIICTQMLYTLLGFVCLLST
jgi:hypothetical protein